MSTLFRGLNLLDQGVTSWSVERFDHPTRILCQMPDSNHVNEFTPTISARSYRNNRRDIDEHVAAFVIAIVATLST
jgi:hypothetical protein